MRSPVPVIAAAWCAVGASCDKAPAPPPVLPQAPERRAVLESVSGEVRVKRSDSDDWVAAMAGTALARDDKIRTMKDASAMLRFDEGTELAIDQESLVSISDLPTATPGTGGVTLLRGKVDAEVDRTRSTAFTVRTPAAKAIVAKEIVFR